MLPVNFTSCPFRLCIIDVLTSPFFMLMLVKISSDVELMAVILFEILSICYSFL